MKPSKISPTTQPLENNRVAIAPTIAPQRAVQEYLNALLQDATSLARAEDLPVVEAPPIAAAPAVKAISVEPVATKPAVKRLPAGVEPSPLPSSMAAVTAEQLSPAKRWENGRPCWAQQRFECLLFKVAGLTLAVPLVELGGVLVMEEELRPLFGQPDWFLGLLPSKTAGTVKAIDTARWVMAEKYPQGAAKGYKYVIMMAGSEWGMACDAVEEAVTLEPEQVRWRDDRSRRPWLAGTVIEHMCAIMDVSALLQLLEQSRADNAKRG